MKKTLKYQTYETSDKEPITEFDFSELNNDEIINVMGASISEYVKRANKTVDDLAANPVMVATILALAESYPEALAEATEENDADAEDDDAGVTKSDV